MKKMGSLILSFTCLLQPVSAFIGCCYTLDSEYELIAGYRLDALTTSSNSFSECSSYASENRINVDNINIIEIGAKAKWVLYDHWLLKGFFKGGTTSHGKFVLSDFDELSYFCPVDLHVCKGNSKDASVAVGYVYEPYCDFEITPLIGLGYDYLRVSMEDSKTDDSSSFRRFEGLTYKSKWTGPWVGLDLRYTYSCFEFDAGYEYHWTHWKGNLDTPKCHGHRKFYDEVFKTNNSFGNIGYVAAGWNINSCFYAGLELKFQYWKAHQGREYQKRPRHHGTRKPVFVAEDVSFIEASDSSDFNEFFSDDTDIDISDNFNDPNNLFIPRRGSSSCCGSGHSTKEEVVGKLNSATWKSFSVTFVLRNTF